MGRRPSDPLAGTAGRTHRVGGWMPEALLVVGASLVVVDVVTTVVTGFGNLYSAGVMVVTVVAATIVRRARPALPISALYAAVAALAPATDVAATMIRVLLDVAQPRTTLIAWLDLVNDELAVAAGMVAAYGIGLFPEGRFETAKQRRILRATWVALPIPALMTFSSASVPLPGYLDPPDVTNPLYVLPLSLSPATGEAVTGLAFLVVLVGPALLLVRYRSASPDFRRRMRWLLVPCVAMAVVLTGNLVVTDSTTVGMWVLLLATNVAGDVALTLGILAPARIDADATVRRTVVFGVLWSVIAGAYVAVATVVGVLAGRQVSTGWAILAALVVALVFQPARDRLERLADRWLFGDRPDPARVVASLGETLAGTFDLDSLLPRIAAALEDGLGLSWARVRHTGDPDPRALCVVPVEIDGEKVGFVECGPKRAGAWTQEDREVVATLAGQAALAVRNVRLARNLTEKAAELDESRARLVRAQESERRRIERNIHDGVQQDLVALIGQTGLARRRLRRFSTDDAARAESQLADVQLGLERLLSDLRELAAGVYPSVLSDHGLAAAVEALVERHPVPVELKVSKQLEGVRLPEHVEGAAYFTVAEALANSLKHSGAHALAVELERPDGTLTLRVSDDGAGFTPPPPPNHGLSNLIERARAVNGSVTVISAVGSGTTLEAEFALTGAAGGDEA